MLNNKELPGMIICIIMMGYASWFIESALLFISAFACWMFFNGLYIWNELLRDEVKNKILSKVRRLNNP